MPLSFTRFSPNLVYYLLILWPFNIWPWGQDHPKVKGHTGWPQKNVTHININNFTNCNRKNFLFSLFYSLINALAALKISDINTNSWLSNQSFKLDVEIEDSKRSPKYEFYFCRSLIPMIRFSRKEKPINPKLALNICKRYSSWLPIQIK